MILDADEYSKLVEEWDKHENMIPELQYDFTNEWHILDFDNLEEDQKELVNRALGA